MISASERITLREFAPADLDDLAPMVAEPDQMRFYERTKAREEAAAWIERQRAFYAAPGFAFWLIELRSTGEFGGYCGIRPLSLDGADEVEIGWHVHRRLWNTGVATEAATAARDVAFGRFGLHRLVAVVHPDHGASRRVAEKIGMRAERATTLAGDYPAIVYALASGRARRDEA